MDRKYRTSLFSGNTINLNTPMFSMGMIKSRETATSSGQCRSLH
nr:MAG TPA: hypothetical protein [Caudoviricetes sp.]